MNIPARAQRRRHCQAGRCAQRPATDMLANDMLATDDEDMKAAVAMTSADSAISVLGARCL